jgi:hypothetical protein
MDKKGVVDVQFNWIFVIIAGALILLFFVSIVTKQKQISDNRISSTILVDLESILSGAKVSTKTVNVITVPNRDVEFECEKYSIGSANVKVKDKILFSPDLIRGRELITWAVDWSLPFWVTNFLFLTTKEVRYVIVDEADPSLTFAEEIYSELLPDETEITKEMIQAGDQIKDLNNYRVKFVYVDTDPSIYGSMLENFRRVSDDEVSAIQVKPDASSRNFGTVEFYEKKGTSWVSQGESYYLKKEALTGAIFAADVESYNCSMLKAFDRLRVMASIYVNKTESLISYYAGNTDCQGAHTAANNELQNIESDANDFLKDRVETIYSGASDVEHQNGVAQIYSCVLVY